MEPKYFIKLGDSPWVQVTKAEFVSKERNAGFHNTMGQPDEPATGGFSGSPGGETISGKVRYNKRS